MFVDTKSKISPKDKVENTMNVTTMMFMNGAAMHMARNRQHQQQRDRYEEWQRYKASIARGEVKAHRVTRCDPEYYSGNILKTKYRSTFKKLWFDDRYADVLLRAYEDDDRIWFKIIYQYYPVPVEALLLVQMLIQNMEIRPISILNNRDYRRYQKLIRKDRSFYFGGYLQDIEAKIEKDGQPLVM